MAELTYRTAIARGIAQEMERDSRVVFIGEDIGAAAEPGIVDAVRQPDPIRPGVDLAGVDLDLHPQPSDRLGRCLEAVEKLHAVGRHVRLLRQPHQPHRPQLDADRAARRP